MLRIVLALLLLAFVGGFGYFLGRSSTPPITVTRTRVEPAPQPPSPRLEQTAPPEISPSVDLSSPNLPGTVEAKAIGDASRFPTVLGLPIAGLKLQDIQDTFHQTRGNGERQHEATDILAPRGTPVVAVDTGIVAKLFESKPGGLTVYQFDSNQNYAYYYAHLDGYAPGLKEGMLLKRGDAIGYVGSTGNASPGTPHLHFAIFELGPEKRWWEGKPLNPYPLLTRAVGK